jgi:hypothetical protein
MVSVRQQGVAWVSPQPKRWESDQADATVNAAYAYAPPCAQRRIALAGLWFARLVPRQLIARSPNGVVQQRVLGGPMPAERRLHCFRVSTHFPTPASASQWICWERERRGLAHNHERRACASVRRLSQRPAA